MAIKQPLMFIPMAPSRLTLESQYFCIYVMRRMHSLFLPYLSQSHKPIPPNQFLYPYFCVSLLDVSRLSLVYCMLHFCLCFFIVWSSPIRHLKCRFKLHVAITLSMSFMFYRQCHLLAEFAYVQII